MKTSIFQVDEKNNNKKNPHLSQIQITIKMTNRWLALSLCTF